MPTQMGEQISSSPHYNLIVIVSTPTLLLPSHTCYIYTYTHVMCTLCRMTVTDPYVGRSQDNGAHITLAVTSSEYYHAYTAH